MTAAEIIVAVEGQGAELIPIADDRLRIRGVSRLAPETVETLRARKTEIIPFLRDREAVIHRAEALLVENVAIREGTFPLPEMKFCAFHIGRTGKDCKRCGGSWMEHFQPSPSAHTKRGAA